MVSNHGHRSKALNQIALLAARSPTTSGQDFAKLYANCTRAGAETRSADQTWPALEIEETETILALCNAAPHINTAEKASKLLLHLVRYLESPHIVFGSDTLLYNLRPSPWEILTSQLARAFLVLGLKYPTLHSKITECFIGYLQECHAQFEAIDEIRRAHIEDGAKELHKIAVITTSLLGFLQSTAAHANFFRAAELSQLVSWLRKVLVEDHLNIVENVFWTIRGSESSKISGVWEVIVKRYAGDQTSLGAMLLQERLMSLLVSATSLQVATAAQLIRKGSLDILMSSEEVKARGHSPDHTSLLKSISTLANDSMNLVAQGAKFLQLSSTWQQSLAFSVRAKSLNVYINCLVADHSTTDTDILVQWLQKEMASSISMADEDLASVVLKSLAIVSRYSSSVASDLGRNLPRFIVQSGIKGGTVDTAARCLTHVLRLVSQDAVITGIYTLGNVLSTTSPVDSLPRGNNGLPNGNLDVPKPSTRHSHHASGHPTGSVISLNMSGDEDTSAAYGNVIRAIVCIAVNNRDEKIAGLAQSMLLQKFGRISAAVDLHVVREAAHLALLGGTTEFKSLLKLYNRISHEGVKTSNQTILSAVRNARIQIAKDVSQNSTYLPLYLENLLEGVISKGDIHDSKNTHREDVDLAAREIVELISPLATLVSAETKEAKIADNENIARLHREAWFNLVIHGITPMSGYGQEHKADLQILAMRSRALIAESRGDQFESDLELNTILRRGINGPNTAEQKKRLIQVLPKCEGDIRSLSYPKVVFLNSMHLLETLRAEGGNCSHILIYFLDPSLNGTAMENCTTAVAEAVMTLYLKRTSAGLASYSGVPSVAEQLANMFMGCCHRIKRVQQIAARSADQIVQRLPSALCQKASLFALLELLSIMWTSCLEIELDEYELKSRYTSERGNVSIDLSDDYGHRRTTLDNLYKRAKSWLKHVIDVAPFHVKGLLQTYLSEYSDDGTYGHMALGRSFAIDMGSIISAADQKLVVTDRHGECNINTGSDFVAQYTSRQEYKYVYEAPIHDLQSDHPPQTNGFPKDRIHHKQVDHQTRNQSLLDSLEERAGNGSHIAGEELRDGLRRAAALFCRTSNRAPAILEKLVQIPFTIFTKQSIRLGVSVWLNIMSEKPDTEQQVLAMVADGWVKSMHRQVGAYSPKLIHPDPFFLKEEFAPSDKTALSKQQQVAHDLVAPHFRVLQFLMSHYNATKMNNPQGLRIFLVVLQAMLNGLHSCSGHPLQRELHFQIVLFGLTVLRDGIGLSRDTRWQLKDAILSAGLSWFRWPSRRSFGGNRLQIKAEMRVMTDVDVALQSVSALYSEALGSLPSLSSKQALFKALLDNEQMNLQVWLFPLDHERRHFLTSSSSNKAPSDVLLSQMLHVAWKEDPRIAIRLTSRFPSLKLLGECRAMILRHPDSVLDEPDALPILVGPSLPPDILFQRRYLTYWAPVNPVTATTYFLPEYQNDPYLIQYAVRSLESHSVDVTFFYVPQLVQTLRYDVLGYVQRYILETAQVSQLFAHQIIWNMKANAFKDEDEKVEDTLKLTLDIIRGRMIQSFTVEDRDFYEREFTFFDEITDISGKLRPFIKRSKPEKKAKIEEELRKIKVDVGVYLPSNPDGTVIGIDRKSGKPLQSHAKAPFMATFRIRKNRDDVENPETLITHDRSALTNGTPQQPTYYEAWQSAIFKVGDDCRQDVLALQLIAAFRGIFNNVGLDVYVYPYRVTATAPGCGVIDVLPNSISRDMLGREAINGLFEYFISKYGAETSIRFQEARNNFVKSMAAYSVISYLLQMKDRHNGNIMIDDAGHILHIDFGFCFDIAPGGVRFERAPFKLTSEMVAVMGGNATTQSFRRFEELCVKAFLASRPHADKICQIVALMLGSGLPCFKPETIKHLRERFVLDKSEREAAEFMKDLIKKSYGSYSTKGYDQFQLLTNGIPY